MCLIVPQFLLGPSPMAEPQNRILTDAHGDQLSLEHHDDADGIMRSLMLICEFLLNLKGYRDIEGY